LLLEVSLGGAIGRVRMGLF